MNEFFFHLGQLLPVILFMLLFAWAIHRFKK